MIRAVIDAALRLRARLIRAIEARLIDNAGPVLKRAWSLRLVYLGIALEIASFLLDLYGASIPETVKFVIRIVLFFAILYARVLYRQDNLKGCQ